MITPAETAVRRWVDEIVVGLELCPFAKRELIAGRVRFTVSEARTNELLFSDLLSELELLRDDASVETTLLIHPDVLDNFGLFNQFLNLADQLISAEGFEGIFQIASFHPDYQFDGTEPDDVGNFTNRAPYPILHIIREKSLTDAIANYPDVHQIPVRNLARMKEMSHDRLLSILQACITGE